MDPFSMIGGMALGAFTNASQNAKSRNWAREENERAYRRNLKQWERENEYNDPSQKMARLKAAGLNPNLAYGNPTTAGVSASSPQKEPAKGKFGLNFDPLSSANASLLQQQARSVQLANMKEEIDLGLRGAKYDTMQIEVRNPETNKMEVKIVKDTPNMYFKRIRANTQAAQHDTTVRALEAKLANEGFVKGDNAVIRFVATALNEAGISPNEITSKIVNSILTKMGFN